MAEDQRIEDLTRRAAQDVAELAGRAGDLAKEELTEAGKRAFVPTAVAAVGGLFAAVGVSGLLLSPALPYPGPMRRLALGYLALGAAGTLGGAIALSREATQALPKTRHAAKTAVETAREHAPA